MSEIHQLLVAETKRRLFEESFPRLKKCLNQLTETEIWYRPNANSNSVGNLVLHLCGNARQWIIAGLGKEKDTRNRQAEFDQKEIIPTPALLELLEKLEKDLTIVLNKVSTEDLKAMHNVQTFQENGVAILVHVVEHFSYHVGQVTYFVKWKKDMDIGYYEGVELE